MSKLLYEFMDMHKGSSPDSRKVVGIGRKHPRISTIFIPEITLEPTEALELLAWLAERKDELEQLAKVSE